ncbi:class II glutamine amidotransferase [Bifidobacterium sp. ESL0763]|uniref:class II glutamine amidotransferase n=1 Tax=Bifidobacterium sp. ESL0763 TaxID=2983227 RepID=UPI0023F97620|nr:class II glutamine amidotransferase [Bifidobacterium sp. ESL0763]MDF7664430.1 class II glutamine amidotransferase [Bifidobacterium sp. ESL0763]
MSLSDVLGRRDTADFRRLSEIHRDGWGVSMYCGPGSRAKIWDVGHERSYHTTMAAYQDGQFEPLAEAPARSALWHLRWGSPGVPGILKNQQPFVLDGVSFIHNGHISSADGVSILDNPEFDVDQEILGEISKRSDSAIFFAVILRFMREGLKLPEAVRRGLAKLRETYPDSSYNCVAQDGSCMVAVRAVGSERTHAGIVDFYDDYGWTGQAKDYNAIRYRTIGGSGQDSGGDGIKGVVVASSGFRQRADEGWRDLANNHMLVISHATGDFDIQEL